MVLLICCYCYALFQIDFAKTIIEGVKLLAGKCPFFIFNHADFLNTWLHTMSPPTSRHPRFGTNLLYVSLVTLCVPSHFMCPNFTMCPILIMCPIEFWCFFLTRFLSKNMFLRVFRFAEHESDVVFSIYGISTNICQILSRKCQFNRTHKVRLDNT